MHRWTVSANDASFILRWSSKIFLTFFSAFCTLLLFNSPALALNGLTQIVSCANCVTTNDFAGAAANEAKALVSPGTFVVISASNPSTAYIRVTGNIVVIKPTGKPGSPSEPTTGLANIVATPIDESGNSLAGQPEATLEASYNQFDQRIFGGNRAGKIGLVQADPVLYTTFVCNCDLEEMGAQVPDWILSQYNISQLPVNTVVTVQFQDGTTAQFIKFAGSGTFQWEWNGTAHDKQGRRIDNHGNLVTNPNTSGRGGGSFRSAPSPAGIVYSSGGSDYCISTTTLQINGVVVDSEQHITFC